MKTDILIVDDEDDIRALIQGILEDEGYAVRQAPDAAAADALMAEKTPDLLILDIWLQNSAQDGLQILERVKAEHPFVPVLMISGHGTIETAVSAIKQGAYDFIEKPFKSDRLLLMIARALETAELKKENRALKERTEGPLELIGDSPAMTGLRHFLERVAQTNSRVLITGEPGTGKEIAARLLHRFSPRAEGPFMALNCAILHPARLEEELFGSENGPGLLEQANGGTLLLDEVADTPLETQAKILRVLQEQRFQRVGRPDFIEVDVRIIAASNRDLQRAMEEGGFRKDLFYRLNVVPIDMPPLRDHVQDIPALAAWFMEAFSAQSGMPVRSLSGPLLAALEAYHWPGNVRQLKNLVERMMIVSGGPAGDETVLKVDHLPPEITGAAPEKKTAGLGRDMMRVPLRDARELFERAYLIAQIDRFGGNISKTAQFVGMERSALHRKLKQLGVSTVSKHNESREEAA